ncbi:MAG: NUDIX hydrolase [Nocardioides sp.]
MDTHRPAWERVGPDRVVYPGFLRILQRTLRLADGRLVDWDLLDIPPTVTVLPLTGSREVVCVRQFRPGADRHVLSLPGGLIDPGEDALTAARRELREETGYDCAELELVAQTRPHSATSPRSITVAHGCVPRFEQSLDEYEDCEVVVIPLDELRRLVKTGELGATEQTYLALDHLGAL